MMFGSKMVAKELGYCLRTARIIISFINILFDSEGDISWCRKTLALIMIAVISILGLLGASVAADYSANVLVQAAGGFLGILCLFRFTSLNDIQFVHPWWP